MQQIPGETCWLPVMPVAAHLPAVVPTMAPLDCWQSWAEPALAAAAVAVGAGSLRPTPHISETSLG